MQHSQHVQSRGNCERFLELEDGSLLWNIIEVFSSILKAAFPVLKAHQKILQRNTMSCLSIVLKPSFSIHKLECMRHVSRELAWKVNIFLKSWTHIFVIRWEIPEDLRLWRIEEEKRKGQLNVHLWWYFLDFKTFK